MLVGHQILSLILITIVKFNRVKSQYINGSGEQYERCQVYTGSKYQKKHIPTKIPPSPQTHTHTVGQFGPS